MDESGVLVEPGPDDARVDGDRLHVAVVLELPLEGAREHDLRRLRVAVRTLGTVKLSEMEERWGNCYSSFLERLETCYKSLETQVNENEGVTTRVLRCVKF